MMIVCTDWQPSTAGTSKAKNQGMSVKEPAFSGPISALLKACHGLTLTWHGDFSSDVYSTLLTQPAVSTRDLGANLYNCQSQRYHEVYEAFTCR